MIDQASELCCCPTMKDSAWNLRKGYTVWTFKGITSRPQGGITCGAIDEPRKSSKAIDKRVIIDFRDKNVVIARFCDKNVVIAHFRDKNVVITRFCDQNEVFI